MTLFGTHFWNVDRQCAAVRTVFGPMIVPPQEWNHLWAALFPSETIHGYWPLLGNWLPETM